MQFGKHKYALGKRGQVQQVQVVQDKIAVKDATGATEKPRVSS